ncbi:MAG: TetR/AcrR family transcriptional regulator [Streptococcaceae bacterium]|nr:TetR/AcrR family transcriptional regulator [Streptococcaceae bacterium]
MSHTKDFDMKRNEILDCAEQLFTIRGYEATNVNAILKEVGIAKGTFYYYFTSKEEVMDAVIMRIIDTELEYAKTVLSNENLTPIEKLISSLFRKPESDEQKVIIERLYEPNNALMKQRALQRTLEVLCPIYAEMIIEGNKRHDFSSANPLAEIQFLVAGMQTVYDLSSISNSKIEVSMETVLNVFFQVIRIDESKNSKEQIKQLLFQNM